MATRANAQNAKVSNRCDWMTDAQLTAFIESLTGLLHEALDEQKQRKARKQAQQVTRQ